MAHVGEKYEYDVFISYAWAVEAVEDDSLRDWCRYVADRIFSNLRRRFNAQGRFRGYLDRDAAENGQVLGEVLPKAVKSSAVFIAFVSDYYQSDWCQKEVGWFCERFKDNSDDLDKHVFILNIMPTTDTAWPEGFKCFGEKRLYDIFYDLKNRQPLDIEFIKVESLQIKLLPAIEQASAAICDKLETIKKDLDARAEYESSRRWPRDPVLYFEAETQDHGRWAEHAHVLSGKNVVIPGVGPVPANEQSNAETEYADANGVVMLRARSGDNIVPRVKRAYQDLRIINGERIGKRKPQVSLVLLDDLDEPLPVDIKPFKIRSVVARGNFAPKLNEALFNP